MIKNILIFGILLTLLSASGQETVKKVRLGYTTANFANPGFVNGPLKSMTQTSYAAKLINGEVQRGEKLKNSEVLNNVSLRNITFNFNKQGEMISAVLYNDEGRAEWMSVFDNEQGKIQKAMFLHLDTLIRYNRFMYDENGLKEIQSFNADNDQMTGRSIYVCDKNGYHLKSTQFNAEGIKLLESEYEREGQGRIHWATYKDKDGKIMEKIEYLYGESFEPRSMDVKIDEDKAVDIKGKRVHTFDARGNWIKQIRYSNDQPLNITERSYTFY